MQKNSGEMEDYRNRFSFPKNNFFCYKWRIKDHFNSSIDRQRFHLNVQGAGNDRSLMNDRIMGLYKSSFGSSRKDLVVNLANDAMAFLDRRRQQQKRVQESERALCQATAGLAQHVFNILLAFSSELNSLMGLSEIFISANEPEIRKAGGGKDGITTLLTQASFSTCFYRLVVEGRLESLNFYLVPSDAVISLSEISLNYQPLERWQSRLQPNGSVRWFSGEHLIEGESIDVICSELLRVLLESTQERLMPAEMMESTKSIFELSAPAPWEVDATKRVPDSVSSGNSGDFNYTEPELKETKQVKEELPFSTPSMVEDIGLLTLYDIPCIGAPKAPAVSIEAEKQPAFDPTKSQQVNCLGATPVALELWQSVETNEACWGNQTEPVEHLVAKTERECDEVKKASATKARVSKSKAKSSSKSECKPKAENKPNKGKTTRVRK